MLADRRVMHPSGYIERIHTHTLVIASEGINNKNKRETKLIERDYRNIDKLRRMRVCIETVVKAKGSVLLFVWEDDENWLRRSMRRRRLPPPWVESGLRFFVPPLPVRPGFLGRPPAFSPCWRFKPSRLISFTLSLSLCCPFHRQSVASKRLLLRNSPWVTKYILQFKKITLKRKNPGRSLAHIRREEKIPRHLRFIYTGSLWVWLRSAPLD